MLQFLENKNYKWIALPPIGTGINGVPVSDFVSGLIQGINDYLKQSNSKIIECVDIIVFDDSTLSSI